MVFPLFVLSEKVKIAAFPTAAQGPGPGEADLPETVVGPVVRLTEQAHSSPQPLSTQAQCQRQREMVTSKKSRPARWVLSHRSEAAMTFRKKKL